MIHPPSSRTESRLSKHLTNLKSIPGQLLYKIIPLAFGLMALALWAGYQTASTNLSQSLSALPKFKAASQAGSMSSTLEDIRGKFIQLRDSIDVYTPENFHEKLHLIFKDQANLIQEIGIKLPDNMGFVLFRDKGTFIELSHDIASTGSYAPFQQLLTFSLSLNKISLFPTVQYTPQGFVNGSTPSGEAVMRMALPVDDETILILGINFKAWSDQLIPHALQKEFDEGTEKNGTLQLAYYFDNTGWILAERSNQPDADWHPNRARRGFGGDFGRQGYDAAFRPWAQHEKYWRMVTDTREGRAGIIQESASGYSQDFKHNYGFLCYAPIVFSPTATSPPTPIGGIAFFESAPNIFASSLKAVGFYAALIAGGLVFFIFMTLRFTQRLARPFTTSAKELQDMLDQRDLHYLQRDTSSREHGELTRSINTLITLTKGQSEQLNIMAATIQHTHAPLPIDIDRSISSAILAGEFGLVGSSKKISRVRENIHKAAQAGTDVLVWGETGTGKELVASAIHKASSRKNGPYISINCGALDENLLMDTLFGHVAGAFSDAVEDRKGAFIAANGGTLHLDELGNASPRVQQSLLRALSVRHIRPLGSDKEIPFDTRVIAATNADLLKSAKAGTFRLDLYYRLAIINIHIPPLRDRKEDIPELAAFYIIECCKRLKKQTTYLSRGALKALTEHSWPGNVREFSNCLTRAVAYTEGNLILPEHIVFEPTTAMYGPQAGDSSDTPSTSFGDSHPADYLWPAPSRENFSPAKNTKAGEHNRGKEQADSAFPLHSPAHFHSPEAHATQKPGQHNKAYGDPLPPSHTALDMTAPQKLTASKHEDTPHSNHTTKKEAADSLQPDDKQPVYNDGHQHNTSRDAQSHSSHGTQTALNGVIQPNYGQQHSKEYPPKADQKDLSGTDLQSSTARQWQQGAQQGLQRGTHQEAHQRTHEGSLNAQHPSNSSDFPPSQTFMGSTAQGVSSPSPSSKHNGGEGHHEESDSSFPNHPSSGASPLSAQGTSLGASPSSFPAPSPVTPPATSSAASPTTSPAAFYAHAQADTRQAGTAKRHRHIEGYPSHTLPRHASPSHEEPQNSNLPHAGTLPSAPHHANQQGVSATYPPNTYSPDAYPLGVYPFGTNPSDGQNSDNLPQHLSTNGYPSANGAGGRVLSPTDFNHDGQASNTARNLARPSQTSLHGAPTLTPQVQALYRRLMEKGEINERQLEALMLAHSRESFTRADYEAVSGTLVSSRTIQNDLKNLVNLGLLIKSGNGPATCYHRGELPKLRTKADQ